MRRFFLISALFILMIHCKKTNTPPVTYSAKGTLGGSDTTCGGWFILASDSSLFDPLNLDSFPLIKKVGQPVIFTYHKPLGNIMICLIGQPINLISIQDQ
jgi:hypothetical protein